MNSLADLIRGRGEHPDPLVAVEDLDWQSAGRRPEGFAHTVFQLVHHLNYWMAVEFRCIETALRDHPDDPSAGWPGAPAPADEAEWRHEVGLFRANLDQLSAIAEARASTLARIAHSEVGGTVESVLWGLVAHNSYHTGQIVQLRRALGAWPPAPTFHP